MKFYDVTDMIRRRSLRTRSIKMLILDESDEMLNKGFKEQIYDVYRYLPPAIQVNMMFFNCDKLASINYVYVVLLISLRYRSGPAFPLRACLVCAE